VTQLSGTPLSVLDLAPVVDGSTPADALAATLELARAAERLGYRRFWVAEHHNMAGIASSAPAVLLAAIGAATQSIRIGSGGVMLPNHPPLVVAEQFGTLSALHPGRVDLGIGRAPGTDQLTAHALRRSADPLLAEDFPQQLAELRTFFSGDWPAGHAYQSVRATPGHGERPEVWLLGSSGYSAQVAGLLGLPFAFAHHFSAVNTEPAIALYRSRFQPSDGLDEPHVMVCVGAVVADDDADAERLALPGRLSMLRLRQGRPGPMPTVEQAARHRWTSAELQVVQGARAGQVVGSPETVRAGLEDLLARTDADELMVTALVGDIAARVHSYSLLAGLAAPLLAV